MGRTLTALADGSITVDTTNDEHSNPGPGSGRSLREAITTTNGDADFGGCTRSGTAPNTISPCLPEPTP